MADCRYYGPMDLVAAGVGADECFFTGGCTCRSRGSLML